MRFGALLLVHVILVGEAPASETKVDFRRDVRPILAEHCLKCHGFDDSSRQGGLRLDTATGVAKGGESGPVLKVGEPEASELIRRLLTSDPEERMPPAETGKHLKPEQIETLKRWISEGAVYAEHWSFIKPVRAPAPQVKRPDLVKTELDAFLLAELEREGLTFSPEADRHTLARRLALDLIGLPADEKLVAAFVDDPSDAAYETYVDALLASPHYGERWTRHWLDLARYADTKGYEKDLARQLWPWRDWVIAAFNSDMPYDQFTREQLAGDLLPEATREQRVATAFHRNTMVNDEGGTDNEEFRIAAVKDRVDTTMQAWMGLTMGCAKCHSHKYDPLSITDYYSFYAFFNQTEDADAFDESPRLPLPTADEQQRSAELKGQIAAAEEALKRPTPELEGALPGWEAEMKVALDWKVLNPSNSLASSGATLEAKDDHSLLAKGTAPLTETYVVRFASPSTRIAALRLETIPDPTNPRKGTGRAADGNFVLTSIRLTAKGPDGKTFEIPFTTALADHSQGGFGIETVIGNSDAKKGWAISPQVTQRHLAVFSAASPVEIPAGSELTLTLRHDYTDPSGGFALGRFRVAIHDQPAASLPTIVPDHILATLRVAPDERTPKQREALMAYFLSVSPITKPQRDEVASLKEKLAAIKPVEIPVLKELAEGKRRVTKIHNRGNFLDQGTEVQPATPVALLPFPADAPRNRLGVAEWLTSRDNPLTARVAVNRVWAHLFGRGFVETEEDFGASGVSPLHPEVLDLLAVEFMENGWSFKKLLKSIVMSAAYRQSSKASPELIAVDRDNKKLARGPRFRLEAEMIRDQALATSGLLGRKVGGPSVMPWQPDGLWKSTYNNTKWVTSPGEDRWRRGIYTFMKRTTPYPQMLTFDGPSRETCLVRRIRTNTPLQALTTLNDPVFVECAQALARQMAASGPDIDAWVGTGFRRALLRDPSRDELAALTMLYRDQLETMQRDPAAAKSLATEPLGPAPEGSDLPKLAALTAVANVILNLDEFLTKP
ncbi:Planctomycete cytochrome C [Caulifigura coniformis]|uniref:Planctomycete cytochrome C n=1 Tax=Caulifigura coniformis TaxID=2527983 RepID=A0A517SM38_9PLAN|nr:PSD1 and planctomycete cytochrome C domain-containing protein [Caulifigura coniformis]QDT57180.1 Planctomycete cytochrome C [Caulifigura coniformis]